jgi:hydroxymethylglutaryl-CoA reductase
MKGFLHDDKELQKTLDEFSENTLTNFMLPFGVAPNILINDKLYCVPMVIEESSVVAAASKAAKFWLDRGGFKAEVQSTTKVGQVHLVWHGEAQVLEEAFSANKESLIESVKPLMANMKKRGGGLKSLELKNLTDLEEGYFQLLATFETCDAMGANFINSVLEGLGKEMTAVMEEFTGLCGENLTEKFEVIMAILSNYTPECKVLAWVECPISELEDKSLGMSAEHFAKKFARSVRIAEVDVNRATTHNKGVMNGIDSVILATGNDFRAVEACAHTFAARDGQYKSLTRCRLENDTFRFEIEIPLALGTVGGLTALHPMAKLSLDLLGNPSASELMKIVAVIGLAQNFAALRSLVTTGIQKGHMKMHLMNILNHLETSEEEREKAKVHFEDKVISFRGVSDYIKELRNYQ